MLKRSGAILVHDNHVFFFRRRPFGVDGLEPTAISAAVAYYCSVLRSTVRGGETERDSASMDNWEEELDTRGKGLNRGPVVLSEA